MDQEHERDPQWWIGPLVALIIFLLVVWSLSATPNNPNPVECHQDFNGCVR